jgi:hypothetical protein
LTDAAIPEKRELAGLCTTNRFAAQSGGVIRKVVRRLLAWKRENGGNSSIGEPPGQGHLISAK